MYAILFYLYALFGAPPLLEALHAVMGQGAVHHTLAGLLLLAVVMGFTGLYLKCRLISARLAAPVNLTVTEIAWIFIVWILHVTACIMLALTALTARGLDMAAGGMSGVWVAVAINLIIVLEFAGLFWIFRIRPRPAVARWIGWPAEICLLLFGCVFYTVYWDYMGIDRINDYTWTVFIMESLAAALIFMVFYLPIKLPDLLEEFHLGQARGRRLRMAVMLGMGMLLAIYPPVKNTLLEGGRYTALDRALRQPGKVVKLYLSNRGLETLPADIGAMTNLVYLRLTENRLTELPPEIGRLTALKELYIGNNRLTELPPEIGGLTNLLVLTAYNNYITHLPDTLVQARNLERINLRWNSLTNLPPGLAEMPRLQKLRLSGNPLPAGVLESLSMETD